MKCHACHRDNPPNFVVCACGQRRVIDPSDWKPGTGSATTTKASNTNGNPANGSTGTNIPAVTNPSTTQRFTRDATRYLCAAVQTDSGLNFWTVRNTMDQRRRTTASSPGVDLVTVIKYALAARRRHTIRNVLLVLLFTVYYAYTAYFDHFAQSPPINPIAAWVLVFLSAWAIVFGELLVTYYGVLGPQLRRSTFDPANAPEPKRLRIQRRLDEIADYDRGNVTVFSEFEPFKGYGEVFNKWSFSLNIARPEAGASVLPFTVHDLYAHVTEAIRTSSLPRTTVEDRLFISGVDLHTIDATVRNAILPDPMTAPLAEVDGQLLRHLKEDPDPDNRARPYLAVRMHGWSGELVMTIFIRFCLQNDLLFIEAHYALLTPVRQKYRKVDNLLERPSGRRALKLAGIAFVRTPFAVLLSGPKLVREAVLRRLFKGRFQTAATMRECAFDYGAASGPRELASDQDYARFFQKRDSDMYVKLAERRIMDCLVEFLELHHVDASELIKRQTMILNNGVYVGAQGSVNANSISVGYRAMARTLNLSSASGAGAQGKAV